MPPPANKLQTIVDDLRQRIVGGTYEPGARLPTRANLQEEFQVSPTTLQRVFDSLLHDGFVETRGKAGTFVSELSPHLTQYAVLLHGMETSSRLYRALATAAMERGANGRQVSCYRQIDQQRNSADFRRLLTDLRAHRVAGIVFSTHPFEFLETPLMTLPGIPRAALMSTHQYPNVSAVSTDLRSFVARSLEFLARRGRRRVAWLFHQQELKELDGPIRDGLAAHGMTSRPSWSQYLSKDCAIGVSQTTRLLFDGPGSCRPDGLIIVDDNLVEPATRGLLDAGVTPETLDVIGLCNYPEAPPSSFPVTQLGFDIGAVIDRCFANIDLERQGEQAPSMTQFPAVFAHEISPNRGALR